MAIHDYIIGNQGFPAFRSDLNDVLAAIVSNNSSATEPATRYAYMMWYDSTANIWKMRNAANDAWISLATFDQATNTVNFLDSSVSILGLATSATGTVLTLTDTHLNSTVSIRLPDATSIQDDSGNEYIKFLKTASAINEISVTNSDTGNNPEISATGDDTNIDLKLTPKGSGNLVLDGIKFPNADGTANQVLQTDGSGNLSFADSSGGIAWQSVQTTGFTAVKGNAYPCDTTSAGFTVTLPATPSAGDQVQLVDYAGTFDTNQLIIDPNGEDIEGGASNLQLTGEREGVILTYIDSTQGWIATSGINEGTDALEPNQYSIDFLVIGGGGSGGSNYGGGGGAGGYRTSTQTAVVGTVITVTVGDGGASAGTQPYNGVRGSSGSNSSISGSGLTTITSAGGGAGGTADTDTLGISGGSGGGGASTSAPNNVGGSGNTPSTSPSQGNNGGTGVGAPGTPYYGGGGGGGAGATGTNGTTGAGGAGGNGTASSITGSSVTRAGGGAGGSYSTGPSVSGGTGGGGGNPGLGNGVDGTANTGGGGGGSGMAQVYEAYQGGAGGKGVVILSMPLAKFSNTTTGSPTESDDGTTKVLIFNGDGSYTA